MSDPIYKIIERLALIEGKTTPVSVKHGLNQQQRDVPQLPALFKPKNISTTLTKKPYQKHPMAGYMVGDSVEPKKSSLEEAMQEVEEDMLSKVKKDLNAYLDSLEDSMSHRDDGRRERSTPELDKLSKKERIDRDLIDKAKSAVKQKQAEEDVEEGWDSEEGSAMDSEVAHDVEDQVATSVVSAQQPVKTYAMEDGTMLECWGNEGQGFEIRHGQRQLPTRFPKLSHADMAVKLFQRRHQQPEQKNQDYLEEK